MHVGKPSQLRHQGTPTLRARIVLLLIAAIASIVRGAGPAEARLVDVPSQIIQVTIPLSRNCFAESVIQFADVPGATGWQFRYKHVASGQIGGGGATTLADRVFVNSEGEFHYRYPPAGLHWHNLSGNYGLDCAKAAEAAADDWSDPSVMAIVPDTGTPPVANISYSATGAAPNEWRFDGSGSFATTTGASIQTHVWRFSDGASASGAMVTKRFAAEGRYTVTLEVTDTGGRTDTDTATLEAALVVRGVFLQPAAPVVGDRGTVEVVVGNTGSETVRTVLPTLTGLPAGRVRVGAPMPTSFDLAPGQTRSFMYTADAVGAGDVTLTGVVAGTGPRGPLQAQRASNYHIVDATVRIELVSRPERPVVGEPFTVTARISNLTNLGLLAVIPELSVVSGNNVVLGPPAPMTIPRIPEHGSATVAWTVSAPPGPFTLRCTATGTEDSAAMVQRTGRATVDLMVSERELRVTTTGDEALPDDARDDRICDVDPDTDGDQCTLRAALQLATHLGGAQLITFDIPGGGVPRIAPETALPPLVGPTAIDGSTQPGGWVELVSPAAGDMVGIEMDGERASVRGLALGGWDAAIFVSSGTGHRIRGNRIGTDASGTVARRNAFGIDVGDGSVVTIGGTGGLDPTTCTGDCNLISASDEAGVRVVGEATIIGNSIGTDVNGTRAVANKYGIWVAEGHAEIGAATSVPGTGAGNLISGNRVNGVRVEDGSAAVHGNLIGLDRSGGRALVPADAHPSEYAGVTLARLGGSLEVGGSERDGNVIGGFVGDTSTPTSGLGEQPEGQSGIHLASGDAIIKNNRIGTDLTGRVAVPNLYGISSRRALTTDDAADLPRVLIDDNLISGNLRDGVLGGARVAGNRIGTDVEGLRAVPNGGSGVVDAGDVGGERPAGSTTCEYPCNLISGNHDAAVSSARSVMGNFIGTDLTGRLAIPNGPVEGGAAVFTSGNVGGPSGAVAGTCDRACNLIAGNHTAGVRARVVQGNVIGATIDLQPLPNARGVLVDMEPALIGGDEGRGNRITFNSESALFGVAILPFPPTQFEVIGNVITGNGGGFAGLTSDGAPAGQELFGGPFYDSVVESANRTGGSIAVEGQVLALPSIRTSDVRVDVYGAQSCEPGVQPEQPLGSVALGLTSDNAFQVTVPAAEKYGFVMAIATYGGFSRWPVRCAPVTGSRCPAGATLDSVACRLRDLSSATDGLAGTKPGRQLRGRLDAATAAVDRALSLLQQGKAGPAKRAVRKALKAVAAAEKALRSKKVAAVVPADVRGQLSAQLATLKTDLGTLKRAPAS